MRKAVWGHGWQSSAHPGCMRHYCASACSNDSTVCATSPVSGSLDPPEPVKPQRRRVISTAEASPAFGTTWIPGTQTRPRFSTISACSRKHVHRESVRCNCWRRNMRPTWPVFRGAIFASSTSDCPPARFSSLITGKRPKALRLILYWPRLLHRRRMA